MLHFGYLKVYKTAISQLILLIWLQFGSIQFHRQLTAPPIWGGEAGINFSTKNKEMGGKRMANRHLWGVGRGKKREEKRKGRERVANREGLLEKESAMHSCSSLMYFYGYTYI